MASEQRQIALVTGAARGIGRAIARRLIDDGMTVVVADIDESAATAAARELGACAHAMRLDVTSEPSWRDAIAATGERIGPLTALVNCAGIAGRSAPAWELSVDEWNQVIAIDLTGVFLGCRAALPGMMERGYGRIVNIASIAGKEGNPNAPAYSASKAAVIGLTKSLGKELAGYDIAVNCITPAAARTRIFEQLSEEFIAYMLSKIPRQRFVEVDEIASMVAWLVSAENSFTTGAVFDISGGRATY